MKYILAIFIISIIFSSCSNKYEAKHRTYEQKQNEIKAFSDLDKELKK